MSEESEAAAAAQETRELATEIRVQVWGLRARTREFKEAIAVARAPEPREKDPAVGNES